MRAPDWSDVLFRTVSVGLTEFICSSSPGESRTGAVNCGDVVLELLGDEGLFVQAWSSRTMAKSRRTTSDFESLNMVLHRTRSPLALAAGV